jgi:hypothetical protein
MLQRGSEAESHEFTDKTSLSSQYLNKTVVAWQPVSAE